MTGVRHETNTTEAFMSQNSWLQVTETIQINLITAIKRGERETNY